jgi:RNA polymerase sigma-70 factor (ECF subfamily)
MIAAPVVSHRTQPEALEPARRAPAWPVHPLTDDRFLPTGRPTGGSTARVAAPAAVARPTPAAPVSSAALDDLALLQRVLAKDEKAFETFYNRFRNLMVACVVRVCQRSGVRLQNDDMADLIAEVTLNMVAHDYRRLRLYRTDGGCSVSSWVGVIASSTAHDFLRRERRRRLDPTLDVELERLTDPVDGPDVELIDRQQRHFVDQALASFSERDRDFVDLYFVRALEPEVIAEQMQVSVSTVYSKKAKIKTRLRALARAA